MEHGMRKYENYYSSIEAGRVSIWSSEKSLYKAFSS